MFNVVISNWKQVKAGGGWENSGPPFAVCWERWPTLTGGIGLRPCWPFSVGDAFSQTLLFWYCKGLSLEFHNEKVSEFDSIAHHTLLITV